MIQLLAALVSCLFMLCACAPSPGLPDGLELPALAGLDSRAASGVVELTATGIETLARSSGAIELGSNLYLGASQGSSEWAVYRLEPPTGMTPQSAVVTLADVSTDEAWVAIANYANARWEFSGPYGEAADISGLGAEHVSPGGSVYFAVVVSGAHAGVVEGVALNCEGNLPPVASFTATPQSGVPGTPVALDAGGSSDPDGSIVKYEWDLDGDGVFELDNGGDPMANTTLPDPAGMVDVGLRVTDDGTSTALATLNLASSTSSPVDPLYIYGPGDIPGYYPRLAEVNGYPAIATAGTSFSNPGLRFTRATAADGGAWGLTQTITASNVQGLFMCVVDGKPAISYTDYSVDVKFVRALDAEGTNWGSPVTVAQGVDGSATWLEVVAGRPTVVYSAAGLNFVKADDSEGTAWGSPLSLDSSAVAPGAPGFALRLVNGHPAIGYVAVVASNREARFVRATDADGSAWGPPVTVGTGLGTGTAGTHMEVISGRPAMCWVESTADLKYVRAGDADGSGWGSAITVRTDAYDLALRLNQFNGLPMITCGGDSSLIVLNAVDADGVDWDPALVIDSPYGQPWVAEVAGGPAIAYSMGYDVPDFALKYTKLW